MAVQKGAFLVAWMANLTKYRTAIPLEAFGAAGYYDLGGNSVNGEMWDGYTCWLYISLGARNRSVCDKNSLLPCPLPTLDATSCTKTLSEVGPRRISEI